MFRLDTLKQMDELKDFADELAVISDRLRDEQEKRKDDDQDVIDVLNDVCYKMSVKFYNWRSIVGKYYFSGRLVCFKFKSNFYDSHSTFKI